MISVITPSVRHEGLPVVEKALKRQTMDFEWLIGSPTRPENLTIPFIWVKDPPKDKGDYWVLFKSYNALIRECKGELIVSIQDHTFFDPEALEKFWYHYQEEPKTLVTGVGNKYSDETWMTTTWQDPRERTDYGSYYQCSHRDIEFNFCSIPTEAFYAVGGFDEYMDKYSSLCGLDVVERLNAIGGWDFKIDQTNRSYSTEHGRPDGWEENNAIYGPWTERVKFYIENGPVLDYLKRK